MKQLSGLDASFLYLETPEMPMHVGALHVFELPAGYKGRFVRDLRKPRRQTSADHTRLAAAVVVDAVQARQSGMGRCEPDLDAAHRRDQVARSRRRRLKDLEQMSGKLHPVLLDRSKPLWKFHVFEGLAPSDDGHKRVAMYTQLHHAAVDGQAAVALANVLLDVTEKPREIGIKPSSRPKKYQLGLAEMVSGAMANQIRS